MGSRERRRAPRHVPARAVARVGWWKGTRFQHVPARFRDLSSTGAALTLEDLPDRADAVWVCLAGAQPTDWVPTQVAWKSTDSMGDGQIGLVFPSQCPLQLFRTAIWGAATPGAQPTGQAPPDVASQEIDFPTEGNLPPPPRLPSIEGSASEQVEHAERTFVAITGVDGLTTPRASLGSQAMTTPGVTPLRQTPLAWIIPAFLRIAIVLILAFAAIRTLCDARILQPLVDCLTRR